MPLDQSHYLFDWNFQVHHLDDDGNSLEVLALADNSSVALAAFNMALSVRSGGAIQLRNRMRVVRTSPVTPERTTAVS